MFIDFRLPIYSNNHGELFSALHADVVGLRGHALFYEGSHRKAVQAINEGLDENFMQPVTQFQQAFRIMRDEKKVGIDLAAGLAIDYITENKSDFEKVRHCRALVTCGLIASPEAFPHQFVEHVHNVDCANGELEENLHALVPEYISRNQIESMRNTELLMLSREDWLVRCWRDPKTKRPDKASSWPVEEGVEPRAKMRIMLGVLNSFATGQGYRVS